MTERCLTCRWWTGDRRRVAEPGAPRKYQYGRCVSITSSPAQFEDFAARILPVSAPAWLETHSSFGCLVHEFPREDINARKDS